MASSIAALLSARRREDLAGGDAARPFFGVEEQRAVAVEVAEAAAELAALQARRQHAAAPGGAGEPRLADRREALRLPTPAPGEKMRSEGSERGAGIERGAALGGERRARTLGALGMRRDVEADPDHQPVERAAGGHLRFE